MPLVPSLNCDEAADPSSPVKACVCSFKHCDCVSQGDGPVGSCGLPDQQVDHQLAVYLLKAHYLVHRRGLRSRQLEDPALQSLVLHPDHFFMDAENAFNQVSRIQWKALARIQEHFPFIIPFLSNVYGANSNGWFFGHNCDKTRTTSGIPSLEGFHQGDVLGSWIHCMATLPFVQELAKLVGEVGSSKFFIDDGSLHQDDRSLGLRL